MTPQACAGRQAARPKCSTISWSTGTIKKRRNCSSKNLKILIGHTPFQVLAGAVLGVAIGVLMNL